ncbi:3-deoxy-D-manno-octulosonic acid transferase [Elstera cyanobacteriorum]|nr:3-deoxy-D-manno-octulosonic acid transferase [Elstera cyanobacteriorum]
MMAAAALALYRTLGWGLTPLLPVYLGRRRARGKEHATRWRERLGVPGAVRPAGRLIWLHGASVGESLALLPLIEALRREWPQVTLLITTGSITSAALMAERLPPGALHQFVPLDAPGAVDRFLAHWRPDLVIWTESDLWPTILTQLQRRRTPMVLVNGRLSDRSFRRWQRAKPIIARLLGCFTEVLARGPEDAARFSALGAARVQAAGNLKLAAAPLPVDAAVLAAARARLGDRPVLVAASTHPTEEALIAAAHRALLADFPDLLTIIAPRHPQRGAEIAADLAAPCRSQGADIPAHGLYIADTMGELGLWYRLARVAVIGGSFIPHGGQNPTEAVRLGCPVIFGPHMDNFREDVAALLAEGQAVQVTAETLADAVKTAVAASRLPESVGTEQGTAVETALALVGKLLPDRPSPTPLPPGEAGAVGSG